MFYEDSNWNLQDCAANQDDTNRRKPSELALSKLAGLNKNPNPKRSRGSSRIMSTSGSSRSTLTQARPTQRHYSQFNTEQTKLDFNEKATTR